MSSVLSFHGVTRAFRTGAGVHRLTFQLGEGEIVALIGLNGAGKTTLMRLALGMLRAQQGTVRLFGRPLPSLPTAAWSEVGALVERSTAYPELTVAENLDIARRLRGGARHVVTAAITAWQLDQLTDRRYRTLSQGEPATRRPGRRPAAPAAPGRARRAEQRSRSGFGAAAAR